MLPERYPVGSALVSARERCRGCRTTPASFLPWDRQGYRCRVERNPAFCATARASSQVLFHRHRTVLPRGWLAGRLYWSRPFRAVASALETALAARSSRSQNRKLKTGKMLVNEKRFYVFDSWFLYGRSPNIVSIILISARWPLSTSVAKLNSSASWPEPAVLNSSSTIVRAPL